MDLNANASAFLAYASSGKLTPDETYTVELLIDRIRVKFDPNYWNEAWSARDDAREKPDYRPHFSGDHLAFAAKNLDDISWLSFQRLRDTKRPVRDLKVLHYLPELTGLILTNNEISDLSPVGSCTRLRRLNLNKNPIRSLAPLANCLDLDDLALDDTPIADMSPLQRLPKLRELSLSTDQLNVFRQLERLPALQVLQFDSEIFESFEGFPEMPELRRIRSASVRSLEGIERFLMLENLVNLFGESTSLAPLSGLKRLTHANILDSRVGSVAPLANLWALRDLALHTESPDLDLTPLEGLPALHSLQVKCNDVEPDGLARVRVSLSSWDTEFRATTPRHTPSLDIQVVDQKTFDFYDREERYNLSPDDTNVALLGSELDWLDEKICEFLEIDFKSDEDFSLPYNWGGARSRTLVLLSEHAIEAFPRLVLGLQQILAHARKDWIIYLQSDDAEPEFIVWVYPDKIMTTETHASAVRKLIA